MVDMQTSARQYYEFYLRMFRMGVSLEKLKEIHEDYEAHRDEWLRSRYARSYLDGQFALEKLILEIEKGCEVQGC